MFCNREGGCPRHRDGGPRSATVMDNSLSSTVSSQLVLCSLLLNNTTEGVSKFSQLGRRDLEKKPQKDTGLGVT